MRLLGHFLAILAIFALGAGAGYYYALRPPEAESAAAVWYVDVHGTARDEDGRAIAGVEVSAMRGDITYKSLTNDSGEWDVNMPLEPGKAISLYIIPQPQAISGPCPAILNGNVCEVRIPARLGTRLGPFRIVYPRPTPMPTITPIPSEPVITQTWTPTKTSTPMPTRTATATPSPTRSGTPVETAVPWATPTMRPSPSWASRLKPGFYSPPEWVQQAVQATLSRELGIDFNDPFEVFSAVHGLGLPSGPKYHETVVWQGQVMEVEYQLFGKGDIAIIHPVTDTWLMGVVPIPIRGDSRWHTEAK